MRGLLNGSLGVATVLIYGQQYYSCGCVVIVHMHSLVTGAGLFSVWCGYILVYTFWNVLLVTAMLLQCM